MKEIKQRIKVLEKQISELPTKEQLSKIVKKADDKDMSEQLDALMVIIDAVHKSDLIYCEKTTLESVLK